MGYIDLHTHTSASDGTLSPTQLVRHAKAIGLSALAITDHDTVSGIEEGYEAGREMGLEVIAGVEISVAFAKEMHILGYFIDYKSPKLKKSLLKLQRYRAERNIAMIDKLKNLGFSLQMQDVEAIALSEVIGRPHFAKALMEKGYVSNLEEAFNKYLGLGKPAYLPKERLTPEQGIQLIREAGGIAVLAHPKNLAEKEQELENIVLCLKERGLQGIEAYYTTHSRQNIRYFIGLAKKYDLLISGGSDFHGANKAKIQLGRGFGTLNVDSCILEEIKLAHEKMI